MKIVLFLNIITLFVVNIAAKENKHANRLTGAMKSVVDSYMNKFLNDNYNQYIEDIKLRKIFASDLNNDGKDDIVAQYYLDERDGGSGTAFTIVAIFVYQSGKYNFLTTIETEGGRNGFNVVKVTKKGILVKINNYAVGDGMCCPSVVTYKLYKLNKKNQIISKSL